MTKEQKKQVKDYAEKYATYFDHNATETNFKVINYDKFDGFVVGAEYGLKLAEIKIKELESYLHELTNYAIDRNNYAFQFKNEGVNNKMFRDGIIRKLEEIKKNIGI